MMAPPVGVDDALRESKHPGVVRRMTSVSSGEPSMHQIRTLEIVSLSCATVSILAAVVAFYWFVRMRRSFRQDLIMLLIQSDMMKAFWFMVCPIVYLTCGPISSDDVLCQVSGFFLASSIEAADISVLMIAVHSALCIFRPHRSGGETGLYPYRRYAYAVWFLVPIILAAVIPISGKRFAYNGIYCYLPVEPSWYRMALSWIPRYIIFSIILLVYGWVYIYVGYRFRRLQRDQRRASAQSSIPSNKNQQNLPPNSHDLPPTPRIAHHGLLNLSPKRALTSMPRGRNQSVASDFSILKLDDSGPITSPHSEAVPGEFGPWKWPKSSRDCNPQRPPPHKRPVSDPTSSAIASLSVETSNMPPPLPVRRSLSHVSLTQSIANDYPDPRRSWRRPLGSLNDTMTNSALTLHGVLRRYLPKVPAIEPDISFPPIHLTQPPSHDALRTSRDKTRRQLRLLFIYPLIYLVAWVAPFISQVYRYEESALLVQPYSLLIAYIASLCIGAAVDCCFFSAWERPWRHLRGGFWEGVVRRVRIGRKGNDGGRTREERLRDTLWALDRRAYENDERETAASLMRTRAPRRPREWWDLEDEDGRTPDSDGPI